MQNGLMGSAKVAIRAELRHPNPHEEMMAINLSTMGIAEIPIAVNEVFTL